MFTVYALIRICQLPQRPHPDRTHRFSEFAISRATLSDLSGVLPRTQQSYERKDGVAVKRNLAVGLTVGTVCAQEQAWQHGKALIPFTGFRGRQGKQARPTMPGSCPTIISAHMLTRVAAACAIIIAHWQTCDTKGTRGTGRGSRWRGGITRMGRKQRKGGGNAAACRCTGRGRKDEASCCGG